MRRLHPATIVVSILPKLREVVQFAVPVVIGTVASGRHGSVDWIAPAIGAFTGIFAVGAYWTTRFDIEPDHLIHTTGWIFKRDRRIPLNQVQNVSLRQNLLERIFGVATVDVETSMGHGRDLKLSVLKLADAERFREEILGAAHLDVIVSHKPDGHVMTLNKHDLAIGAITENHLSQIFGLFAIGGTSVGWIGTFLSRFSGSVAALILGGAAMVGVIGLWFWGAVNYYLKYGDFTVYRTDKIYRITYGILNKVQTAIRPERIEFVQLTTTIFQRWMARATLQVGTASTFGEAGTLAPIALFVDRHRAYAGVEEIIHGLYIDELDWKPLHPYFYRVAAARVLTIIGIFGVAAWLLSRAVDTGAPVVWGIFGVIVVLVVLSTISLFLSRAENSFAITDNALVSRRGYFHQSITAIPIERIENIAIRQPLWWMRFGVVGVAVQGMKHHVTVAAMPQVASEELLDRWKVLAAASVAREISDAQEVILEESTDRDSAFVAE